MTPLMEEEVGGTEQFPIPFGRATAKVTTQLKGPTWGRFHPVTQETWSLTSGTHRESCYDASGGLGYILEDAGVAAGHESEDTGDFVETRLGLLECKQDCLAQMIEASFEELPCLVAKAVQKELWGRQAAPLVVQPVVPPPAPQVVPSQLQQVPDSRAPDRAPHQVHCPTELLDATFDVSLLTWMREAANVESCLRTIRFDNATTLGKRDSCNPKYLHLRPKDLSRQKEGVWDQ
ncbi:UNVERIFIED_CONTAM: hypothetical protein K2H54_048737 [Gekko kuhli]